MSDWSLSSFESPLWHAAIANIVRNRSTNRTDVREVALDELDLASYHTVLDLGCGFGFMSEAIAPRLLPEVSIVGVDACEANRQPYHERVRDAGRKSRFIHQRIELRLDWPDDSFDLIVSSYSLYFFPAIIPEIARVLAPHGLFVALTHMEASCRELLRIIGTNNSDSRRIPISHGFSGENGRELLEPWFGEIQRVDYDNSLVFEVDEYDELLVYVRFKLPYVAPNITTGCDLPESLRQSIRVHLSGMDRVTLAKNDAAFRCRKPRNP